MRKREGLRRGGGGLSEAVMDSYAHSLNREEPGDDQSGHRVGPPPSELFGQEQGGEGDRRERGGCECENAVAAKRSTWESRSDPELASSEPR